VERAGEDEEAGAEVGVGVVVVVVVAVAVAVEEAAGREAVLEVLILERICGKCLRITIDQRRG